MTDRQLSHVVRRMKEQATFGTFRERCYEMADAMGRAMYLTQDIIDKACNLYDDMMEQGTSPRRPHCLMGDCLYLMANEYGAKTTVRDFYDLSKDKFGVGIWPRVAWRKDYEQVLAPYLRATDE